MGRMDPSTDIRPLRGNDERRAAQRIMERTWGEAPDEIVALPTLIAAAEAGGLVCGAFQGDALIGFSFAFPGHDEAGPYLHSQMTATLPEARGRGVGRGLKWFQRSWALEQGLDRIKWTFDPLMQANARFNLHHLGATAGRYLVDFYGVSESPLHGGLATDRFGAVWNLRDPRVERLAAGQAAPLLKDGEPAPGLLYTLDPHEEVEMVPADGTCTLAEGSTPWLWAPIPHDLLDLVSRAHGAAMCWRERTRAHFTAALEAGYRFLDTMTMQPPGSGREWPGYLLETIERGSD